MRRKRIITVGAALIAFVAAAAIHAGEKDSLPQNPEMQIPTRSEKLARLFVRQADLRFAQGEREQMKRLCERVLQEHADAPYYVAKAHYILAVNAQCLGDEAEALRHHQANLETYADKADEWDLKVAADFVTDYLSQKKRYDEARMILEAGRKNAVSPIIQSYLSVAMAETFLHEKDYARAIEESRRVVRESKDAFDRFEAQGILFTALLESAAYEECLPAAHELWALSLEPRQTYRARLLIERLMERLPEDREALRAEAGKLLEEVRAQEGMPSGSTAQGDSLPNQGIALLPGKNSSRRETEAVDAALEEKYRQKAHRFEQRGKWKEARAAYLRQIEEFPEGAHTEITLNGLLRTFHAEEPDASLMERSSQLTALLDREIEWPATLEAAETFLCTLYFENRLYDESIALIERFYGNHPESSRLTELRWLEARCRLKMDKVAEARVVFAKLVADADKDKADRTEFMVGYTLVTNEHGPEALEAFKAFLKKHDKGEYAKRAKVFGDTLSKAAPKSETTF
ncbi:MAG: hypothetical protein V1918_07830 [Planctomycetota bacterium]